jgi:hypothetical protein
LAIRRSCTHDPHRAKWERRYRGSRRRWDEHFSRRERLRGRRSVTAACNVAFPLAVACGTGASVRAVDLTLLTNRELLDAWTGSLEEVHRRGVVRTYNNPIGDIAEAIVARHYGGKRAPFDNPVWDVAIGDDLLQVKACRRATPGTKLGFSPLRHREGYTALVLVVFTADMRVEQAWRVPRAVVNEFATAVPHVNGFRVSLSSAVTGHSDVMQLDLDDGAIDQPEAPSIP